MNVSMDIYIYIYIYIFQYIYIYVYIYISIVAYRHNLKMPVGNFDADGFKARLQTLNTKDAGFFHTIVCMYTYLYNLSIRFLGVICPICLLTNLCMSTNAFGQASWNTSNFKTNTYFDLKNKKQTRTKQKTTNPFTDPFANRFVSRSRVFVFHAGLRSGPRRICPLQDTLDLSCICFLQSWSQP